MSKKNPSRPERWAAAIESARNAIETAKSEIESAFADLYDLQQEYQEWLDNLPEVSQGSATEDKLNDVVNLYGLDSPDVDVFGDLESLLDEAEGIDLPRGFGRD
jgi:3-methyladenine DNA glycosylase/8-oxoguanine DNA glycosylase